MGSSITNWTAGTDMHPKDPRTRPGTPVLQGGVAGRVQAIERYCNPNILVSVELHHGQVVTAYAADLVLDWDRILQDIALAAAGGPPGAPDWLKGLMGPSAEEVVPAGKATAFRLIGKGMRETWRRLEHTTLFAQEGCPSKVASQDSLAGRGRLLPVMVPGVIKATFATKDGVTLMALPNGFFEAPDRTKHQLRDLGKVDLHFENGVSIGFSSTVRPPTNHTID